MAITAELIVRRITVDLRTANLRTGAYSIMGLLRYAGAADDYYFFA